LLVTRHPAAFAPANTVANTVRSPGRVSVVVSSVIFLRLARHERDALLDRRRAEVRLLVVGPLARGTSSKFAAAGMRGGQIAPAAAIGGAAASGLAVSAAVVAAAVPDSA
jgi:hypothetical protein